MESLANPYQRQAVDYVVGIESRGFILGGAVADRLRAGFVPVRKIGKLPSRTIRVTYDLEYGSDSLEIHEDAIEQGQRVLIVDDLLATGGRRGRRSTSSDKPAGRCWDWRFSSSWKR